MQAILKLKPSAAWKLQLPALPPLTWNRLALGLLLIGLMWRIVRYLLRFPIWGDEAMIAINFSSLDYRQLTGHLSYNQVAPILFLWCERLAWSWLGAGEMSLRLLPFAAGFVSLVLYWRLTGLVLGPRSRLFAVGFLAVANWPVSMCTNIKPYSLDLLFTLAFLNLAVDWLKAPGQVRWLVGLTLLTPLALLGSYPTVFVAGAVSAALLRPVWRQGWTSRLWFAAYNGAVLVSFLIACQIGENQKAARDAVGIETGQFMANYWAEGFPPASPLAFLKWLFLMSTGQIAAYPFGDANGGSSLTVLLALVGAACWARRGRWLWLTLFLMPVFLNFLAAVLHCYPYGASCRLSQHLAPTICILAGLGTAAAIERRALAPKRQKHWMLAVAGLLALIGLIGTAIDLIYPYRDRGVVWMRDTMAEMRTQVPADDFVVLCDEANIMDRVFDWYWHKEENVTWDYQVLEAVPAGRQVWAFHQFADRPRAEAVHRRVLQDLRHQDPSWQLVQRLEYVYEPHGRHDYPQRCVLLGFGRRP